MSMGRIYTNLSMLPALALQLATIAALAAMNGCSHTIAVKSDAAKGGSPKSDAVPPAAQVAMHCWGELDIRGHYARPKEVHRQEVDAIYAYDAKTQTVFATETVTYGQEVQRARTIARANMLFRSDGSKIDLGPFSRAQMISERMKIAEMVPDALLADAREDGTSRTLRVDGSRRLSGASWVEADGVLGDQRIDVVYTYQGNARVPAQVVRTSDGQIERRLRCEPAAYAEREPPEDYRTPISVEAAPEVQVEKLAEGIFDIELAYTNSRALAIEYPSYAVVLEAPHDSETGERILAAVSEATHEKPVRYLMVTHHHPDHAGGFRPFVAADARLVTTPGNTSYFTELAAAPHVVHPDTLARAPRAPRFELVQGKRTFGEPPRVIEAYDVGPLTHHTDEYLIYYLPIQQLLFEGDLVRLPERGPLPPASPRARGLYQAIGELGLTPNRIVQSWPVRDRLKEFSMAMLGDAVKSSQKAGP